MGVVVMMIQTTYRIINRKIVGLQPTIHIQEKHSPHHKHRKQHHDNNTTTFRVNKKLNRITGIQNHEKKPVKLFKQYKPKRCKWCDHEFTPHHSSQRYCSDLCRHYSDQQHTMIRVRNYRKRYAEVLRERITNNKIGTGTLGGHACKEFKEELNKIRKEMRTLGLTPIFSY